MALNPQQMAFKEAYLNPESETFGNALRSGLSAGYTQEYSESIGNQGTDWFAEILGDFQRLQTAEQVIDEILATPLRGDPSLINAVGKLAMFTAETLGKKKYAKRTELTGNDGKDLVPTPILTGIKYGDNQERQDGKDNEGEQS